MGARVEPLFDVQTALFRRRLDQAPKDADFALDYVKKNARTPDQQEAVIAALTFLWIGFLYLRARLRTRREALALQRANPASGNL